MDYQKKYEKYKYKYAYLKQKILEEEQHGGGLLDNFSFSNLKNEKLSILQRVLNLSFVEDTNFVKIESQSRSSGEYSVFLTHENGKKLWEKIIEVIDEFNDTVHEKIKNIRNEIFTEKTINKDIDEINCNVNANNMSGTISKLYLKYNLRSKTVSVSLEVKFKIKMTLRSGDKTVSSNVLLNNVAIGGDKIKTDPKENDASLQPEQKPKYNLAHCKNTNKLFLEFDDEKFKINAKLIDITGAYSIMFDKENGIKFVNETNKILVSLAKTIQTTPHVTNKKNVMHTHPTSNFLPEFECRIKLKNVFTNAIYEYKCKITKINLFVGTTVENPNKHVIGTQFNIECLDSNTVIPVGINNDISNTVGMHNVTIDYYSEDGKLLEVDNVESPPYSIKKKEIQYTINTRKPGNPTLWQKKIKTKTHFEICIEKD